MSVVQLDLQKIEQLLNSATNERQRKMYKSLLDKARSQFVQSTADQTSRNTSSTENQAQTKTKSQTVTKTQAKTAKKKKKATPQSTQATHGTKPSSVPMSSTTEASPAIQSTKPVIERTYIANPTAPLRAPELNSGVASSSTAQLTKEKSFASPQPESKSQSQEPSKQQSNAKPPIFQALGTIIATPYVQDDCLKVIIDEREYDLLYVKSRAHQAYLTLFSELKENGSKPMFLKLYPRTKFDQKSAQPKLSFSLVSFSLNCEKINNYPQGFVLRGIYQYIPPYQSPVISIYRNRDQLKYFKRLNKSQRFNFAKANHIPVVWDSPFEPFQFNPQAEKNSRTSYNEESAESSQIPRYFVEVRAILKDGLFVVEEMLLPPTSKIPPFIKVSTKDRVWKAPKQSAAPHVE